MSHSLPPCVCVCGVGISRLQVTTGVPFVVYLLFVCLFVCLFTASSLPIVVCGVGISRLPVTRRRGSNNEKQQIHSQSIEATKKTLFGRV